jgi:hypothetical protein
MQNLPRLYKIRKDPIHDHGATMHQQAGTGIWRCDMPKKAQKQHHKTVAGKQRNKNWQDSRRKDVEAVKYLVQMRWRSSGSHWKLLGFSGRHIRP